MQRIKRLLALTMACMLAVSLLAACSGNNAGANTNSTTNSTTNNTSAGSADSSGDTAQTETVENASGGEVTTLNVFMNNSGFDASNWGKDFVSRTFVELSGIDLNFEVAVSDDNQRLNLLISSNDLPDLVYTGWYTGPVVSMIHSGLIYTLDELSEKYMPSFMETPFMTGNRDYLKNPIDGNIYTVPGGFVDRNKIYDGTFIMQAPGYYVRGAYMEQLGNPKLETLDDLEAILQKAKAEIPGLTDPLFLWNPVGNGWDANGIEIIYRSMGGRGTYYEAPEGGLQHMVKDPIYKEALLFVNRLYNQGLISYNNFTDGTVEQEGINMSDAWIVAMGHYWRSIVPHDEHEDIKPWPHLEQPGVDYFSPVSADTLNGGGGVHVSKNTQKPEAAIRFMDFVVSDVGQILPGAGLEGQHWEWGGPDNNWIMLIGEAKEAMNKSWNDWVELLGTYRYAHWAAYNYYDSALSWGLGSANPYSLSVYTTQNIGKDYSAFGYIDPDPTTEAGANKVRIDDLRNSYTARICLAGSQAEAEKLYNDMIADMEAQGLSEIEKIWTDNYNARNN